MKVLFFIIPFLFLLSCFEEDKPIPPYPGEIYTIENNIGSYQTYFSLDKKLVMSNNHVSVWDIGFESSARGWRLKINSGKELFVHHTGKTDLSTEIAIAGNETWIYDSPGGHPDSTAFGSWCDTTSYPFASKGYVYLIGQKNSTSYTTYAVIQMVSADNSGYTFNYTTEGSNVQQARITKSDSVNYVYFHLKENIQKNIEPTNYDLLFTPYYDLLFDDDGTPVPYFLRGVFLNPLKVKAYPETQVSFENFSYSDIQEERFSVRQNVIGYDWKDVDIDFSAGAATYYVIPGRTYIISTGDGLYYKLRFLSYTLNGVNGFPRFEFKRLMPVY